MVSELGHNSHWTLKTLKKVFLHWLSKKHLHWNQCTGVLENSGLLETVGYMPGWWPAGGGVVSMVRFSLGGAYRCRCGWAGPFHQPQGLEGVVIQTLLGEKAFCRVQQQQVLPRKAQRRSPWVYKTSWALALEQTCHSPGAGTSNTATQQRLSLDRINMTVLARLEILC